MAYSDESVLSKLSALNETQEGIVTAANWIMFHRYCDDFYVYEMDTGTNAPLAGVWPSELRNCGCKE
jgi:hypothetical protein